MSTYTCESSIDSIGISPSNGGLPSNQSAKLFYKLILPFTEIAFFQQTGVPNDLMLDVFNASLSVPELFGSSSMCAAYNLMSLSIYERY